MAVALCSDGIAGGPHPGCTVSSREFGGGEAPTRGRGSCAGKEAGHQGRGLPAQRQTPGRRLFLEPQVLQAAGRGLAGPLGVRAALLSSHAELCCSVPAFPMWASPPSPWQPGIYSLAPMNPPVLDAPQEQSHSCDLLCPASFAQHHAIKVHPCEGLSPCQHFFPAAASSSGGLRWLVCPGRVLWSSSGCRECGCCDICVPSHESVLWVSPRSSISASHGPSALQGAVPGIFRRLSVCEAPVSLHLTDTCRLRCFLSVLLTFGHIPLGDIAE